MCKRQIRNSILSNLVHFVKEGLGLRNVTVGSWELFHTRHHRLYWSLAEKKNCTVRKDGRPFLYLWYKFVSRDVTDEN